MSDFREEEKLGKLYDSRLTRRLLKYLHPYRWHVALAVSITIGVTAMELVGPYLFHVAIDGYILPGLNGKIVLNAALVGLLWTVVVYAGSILIGFGFQYAQVRIMQWVGQETMYDLRKEIFEHLQRLPMSFFDRSPVGRLVTRTTTDVDALNDLFAAGVVAMLNDFVLLFSMAALLLKWHWLLALAALSPLPFMFILTYFFRNKVRDANRRIRTAIARINGFLQEHVSGMAVVQLFNREHKSQTQFAGLNKQHMVAYKDAIDAFAFFYPAVEFLSMGGVALLYWIGGVRVIDGTIEIGVLLTFMLYAQRFFRPIQDLSEKFNILQSAMAASERIFKLLDEPITIASASNAKSLPAPRGEIEFRNVWFAYHGGANPEEKDWVLRDVSFRVEPGQTLAIVGHTGAGKTTIIQLLLRFYDIQRGQILLDGVDIREMDLQDVRRLFGIRSSSPERLSPTSSSAPRQSTAAQSSAPCAR
jgi:ATP-binding cassette subfamily B multidrug efflux pump